MKTSLNQTGLKQNMEIGIVGETMLKMTSCIYVICCIIGIVSCSSNRDFKNPEMALEEYQLFMDKVSSNTSCTTESLSNMICEWQELSDTVYAYLSKSEDLHNHGREQKFFDTCDSIRYSFLRIISSGKYSYEDVLSIKTATNPYRRDSALDSLKTSVFPFFDNLDKAQLKDSGKDKALQDYVGFVHSVYGTGINNEEEFFRFIKFEDILFRRYLYHLGEVMGESMTQVTFETDSICRSIFNASSVGTLAANEVMANMAIRTNRRLLQNAKAACDCILQKKNVDPQMSVAFIWMAVQPFVSIDTFGLALLSEEQRNDLHEIASQITKLAGQDSLVDDTTKRLVNNLPSQILQLYISSL